NLENFYSCQRPDDDLGSTGDIFQRHKRVGRLAMEGGSDFKGGTGVRAMRTIIAEDKNFAFRHHEFFSDVIFLRRTGKAIKAGVIAIFGIEVWFIEFHSFSIFWRYRNFAALDLHRISGNADNPFYILLRFFAAERAHILRLWKEFL